MLYQKVLLVCQTRGVTPTIDDFEVRLVDGVETLTVWNAATLGAVPTPADLAAITDAAALAARRARQFTTTSRQKDVLATIALIVRARNVPAWTALTTPQKVSAVLAEADIWIAIRDFLELNA